MLFMMEKLPSFEAVKEAAAAAGLPLNVLNRLQELYGKITASPALTALTLECCNAIVQGKGRTDCGKNALDGLELKRFRVLLILLCFPAAKASYAEAGYSAENFRDAWGDLAHWGNYYLKETGELRFDDEVVFGWYFLHVTAQLIPMGRLQFQLPVFYHDAMDLAPLVQPGDPLVEFHIYGGEPLNADACRASFQRLPQWLARYRKDYDFRGVIGHSWLFDPELAEFLPPGGNIAQFRDMGHLIATPEPSDVLWRIFGNQDPEKVADPTTLQRKIRDFYRSGRQLHMGYWFLSKEELSTRFPM